MLSHSQLAKVRRFESQYGESEGTFSPDWHLKNPVPQEGSALSNADAQIVGDAEKTVRVQLGYLLLADGTETIAHRDTELPEGARWRE